MPHETEPIGKRKTSLYSSLIERVADHLRDTELREACVTAIVSPILQSSVLKRMRLALYCIATLLFVMLALLVVLTFQVTFYIVLAEARTVNLSR
jgi:hypothetical protein